MLAIGVVAPENTADRTGKITTGGDLKGCGDRPVFFALVTV
jgi:hypothetical protein